MPTEEAADSIRHYRVDKMLNMHQMDITRTGRKNIEDFDLITFSKKTFGMFSGTDERIILKCGDELVGVIIDRFGKDVMIMPVDDQYLLTHVNVTVSPSFSDGSPPLVPRLKSSVLCMSGNPTRHTSARSRNITTILWTKVVQSGCTRGVRAA